MNRASGAKRAACVLAAGLLLAGCRMRDIDAPARPEPITAEALKPTANVQKVAMMSEPAARDSDNDGTADVLSVNCYLFPSRLPGSAAVVGKGSFRFEIYDALKPADERTPLVQVNFNQEQSAKHLIVTTMPNYVFHLPLRGLPGDVLQVFVLARFFPDGAAEEADPGRTTAAVPSFSRSS